MYWWIPAILVPVISGFSVYFDKVGLKRAKTSVFGFLFSLFIALILSPLVTMVEIKTNLLPFMYLASVMGSIALYLSLRVVKEDDISVVSPIVGSINPLLTWFMATTLIGEKVSSLQLLGILVVMFGGVLLSLEGKAIKGIKNKKTILYLVLALFLYATASTIDKYLMNQGLSVVTYMVIMHWFATFNLGIILSIRHGKEIGYVVKNALSSDWRYILIASILILAYRGLQIYAISLGPVSLVLALKRLSALVAVILGGELLHEKYWIRRLIAGAIMAIGGLMVVL